MTRAPKKPGALKEQETSSHFFRAMGTEAYLEIVHRKDESEKASASIKKTINLCFEKIKIFSRFDPESELSIFNRNLGVFRDASPDMLTVALHALSYHKESDGLFDPRILSVLEDIGYRNDFSSRDTRQNMPPKFFPTSTIPLKRDLTIWGEAIQFKVKMDFSGIAKGYILDIMAKHLENDGWKNFLVDSGGDMVVRGTNRKGKPWRIDIENIPEKSILIEISNKGIATSGITRRQWTSAGGKRFHHLIHPRHPNSFAFNLLSVTAISASAERADFLAKTLFLMGKKEGLACAKKYSIPAIFVEDGEIPTWHTSPEVKKYLSK